MIAVIFEIMPRSTAKERYHAIAAELRPQLEKIDGFISVERFASLSQPEKLLSLSFWRDEESVARWRAIADHREAQLVGRAEIFASYRLRVATILRDYGTADRSQAPSAAAAKRLGAGRASKKARISAAKVRL